MVARCFLQGAGTLLPFLASLFAITAVGRRWALLVPLLYSILLVLLLWEWAIPGVLENYRSGAGSFQDDPIFWLLTSTVGVAANVLMAAIFWKAGSRSESRARTTPAGGTAPIFGRESIAVTTQLLWGLGLFSIMRGVPLTRLSLAKLVPMRHLLDWAMPMLVALAWGTCAIWIGRQLKRDPKKLVRLLIVACISSGVAAGGVFGLETLYWARMGDPAQLSRNLLWCASNAIPWLGCFFASCMMVWYWRPVIRGRDAIDWADFEHICLRCGYDLTGNLSGVCPECGAERASGPQNECVR